MQERVRALFLHLSLLYADLQVSVSSAIKPVADPEGVQGVRSSDPEGVRSNPLPVPHF